MAISAGMTTGGTSANGTLSISKPPVLTGDVLVAQIAANGTSVAPPQGWVRIFATGTNPLTDPNNPKQWFGLKVMDGTESAAFTWTAGIVAMSGCVTAFRGVDGAFPLDTAVTVFETAGTATAAAVQLPSAVPARLGVMLVYCSAANSSTVTFGTPASPGVFTEAYDSGASKSSALGYFLYGSKNPTGAVTVTLSAVRSCCGALACLRPAIFSSAVGKAIPLGTAGVSNASQDQGAVSPVAVAGGMPASQPGGTAYTIF